MSVPYNRSREDVIKNGKDKEDLSHSRIPVHLFNADYMSRVQDASYQITERIKV